MKKLHWAFILLIPFVMTACIDDGDDEDDDPDADSGWTAQSTGVSNDYRMIPSNPTWAQILAQDTFVCESIAADDATENDSKMVALNFDSDGVNGTLEVVTFLGSADCLTFGYPREADYADVVSFTHVLSSKGDFDFNRLDITVTGFSKKSLTSDGAAALNSASACGKTDWTDTAELDLPDTSVCSDGLDKIGGFMLNDVSSQLGGESMPLQDGTVLEGVQTWSGGILTLALAPEGERPTNVSTTRLDDPDTADNWVHLINGAAVFSR